MRTLIISSCLLFSGCTATQEGPYQITCEFAGHTFTREFVEVHINYNGTWAKDAEGNTYALSPAVPCEVEKAEK